MSFCILFCPVRFHISPDDSEIFADNGIIVRHALPRVRSDARHLCVCAVSPRHVRAKAFSNLVAVTLLTCIPRCMSLSSLLALHTVRFLHIDTRSTLSLRRPIRVVQIVDEVRAFDASTDDNSTYWYISASPLEAAFVLQIFLQRRQSFLRRLRTLICDVSCSPDFCFLSEVLDRADSLYSLNLKTTGELST